MAGLFEAGFLEVGLSEVTDLGYSDVIVTDNNVGRTAGSCQGEQHQFRCDDI